MKSRYLKRTITVMILAMAVFLMGGHAAQDSVAFAEGAGTDAVVLRVFYDNELMNEYTEGDLESIAQTEGSTTYDFSAMNTYPTPELVKGVTGPTVKGVIDDAFENKSFGDIPSGLDKLADDQLIDIRDNADGYRAVFTVKQLFKDKRYFFPNVMKEASRNGATAQQESYEENIEVPAIISLEETDDPNNVGRFMIGQLAPHEQNKADWVQGVMDSSDTGLIVIRSDRAQKLNAVTGSDAGPDGKVFFGRDVTLAREVNDFQAEGGKRYWIYYTTDGTEPTRESAIYNYNGNAYGKSYEKLNKPVLSKEKGESILKVKVYGNGMIESDTSVFEGMEQAEPKPVSPPAKPSIKKLKLKKKTITVQWKTVAGASGYEIFRAEKKKTGKYKLVKTVNKAKTASWKNKKLKKGKKYFYKIRAYKIVDGKKVYSSFSAVKYKKVK